MLKNLLQPLTKRNQLKENESQAPNLLSEPSKRVVSSIYITLPKIFIFVISLSFVLLFLSHWYLDHIIKSLYFEISSLSSEVESYSAVQSKYESVAKRLESYKRILGKRVSMKDKTSFVYKYLSGNFSVESVKIDNDSFSITIKGGSPLTFSKLILNYLGENYLNGIVIKSAEYRSELGVYRVELVGNFK